MKLILLSWYKLDIIFVKKSTFLDPVPGIGPTLSSFSMYMVPDGIDGRWLHGRWLGPRCLVRTPQ